MSLKCNAVLFLVVAQMVIKRPEFEIRPQGVVVNEGGSIVLECAANGYPSPQIQWLKDQKLLDLIKYVSLTLF